jgi:hypothetical protein
MAKNIGDKNGKTIFLRELKRWLLFIICGGFLIVFNQDVGSWKFPMGATQEWVERARFLGWIIMIGGYPISLLLRLLHHLIKKKN